MNALQQTLVSKESGRQAVGRTTQLRHFVTTVETAFVESVSACQEITQKKLYQESFVSVTTSPVTDIKENCALVQTMESVSVEIVFAIVNGMCPATVHASAKQVMRPASHLMENT